MGAMPATVFTLLARPFPANARRPAASCTSTHESAEKLIRRRARPAPAVESVFDDAVAATGIAAAAPDGDGGCVDAAGAGDGDAGGGDWDWDWDCGGLIVGGAAAVATISAVESGTRGAAFGCTAKGAAFTGVALRECHGLHQSTPRISNTTPMEPAICGQGKLLTAGSSVRSRTFANCAAEGFGACALDS